MIERLCVAGAAGVWFPDATSTPVVVAVAVGRIFGVVLRAAAVAGVVRAAALLTFTAAAVWILLAAGGEALAVIRAAAIDGACGPWSTPATNAASSSAASSADGSREAVISQIICGKETLPIKSSIGWPRKAILPGAMSIMDVRHQARIASASSLMAKPHVSYRGNSVSCGRDRGLGR